ncbi:MAG: hypothetical protein IID51_05805 [Proteobacteria bacterium]|nr:hypothetical protein [Pseudomonadota bacterium]
MLSLFKNPPFVGVIAFLSVLLVQPIGHIVMILMEELTDSGITWYAPMLGAAPVIPEGYVDSALLENNVYWAAFAMGAIGLWIFLWGYRRGTEIAGTWAGFIGSTLLWTGWVEFSLHYYSRVFGIKALCMDGSLSYTCAENPATKPEYFLMQGTVGFLLAVGLFFLLNKETRCNAFRWVHRKLPWLNVGKPTTGMKRNFANIVAIENIGILWFFYVYLLFVYDESIFGEFSLMAYGSFVGFLLWSLYLMQRLIRYSRVTSALRYAIPTAIIFWNSIEIMGRWSWFKEFWIHPLEFKLEGALTLAALVIFAIISIRTARDKSKRIDD